MSSDNSQTIAHPLGISENAFDAGDLPMFRPHENVGESMNVDVEQLERQQLTLRTSHILMQDLEASDDDSPGGLSPADARDISDDDVKDEHFILV